MGELRLQRVGPVCVMDLASPCCLVCRLEKSASQPCRAGAAIGIYRSVDGAVSLLTINIGPAGVYACAILYGALRSRGGKVWHPVQAQVGHSPHCACFFGLSARSSEAYIPYNACHDTLCMHGHMQ